MLNVTLPLFGPSYKNDDSYTLENTSKGIAWDIRTNGKWNFECLTPKLTICLFLADVPRNVVIVGNACVCKDFA